MIKNASIKVAIKIKPCPKEYNISRVEKDKTEICIQLPTNDVQRMEVDIVHDANSTEESIYETGRIKELLGKFIQGYNVAILTYGQTGSGKTFAFEGSKDHPGIINRSIS